MTPITQPAPLLRTLPKSQAEWELFLTQLQTWRNLLSRVPQSSTPGFGVPTGASVINDFPGATATLVQTSETVAQILTILQANGFAAP